MFSGAPPSANSVDKYGFDGCQENCATGELFVGQGDYGVGNSMFLICPFKCTFKAIIFFKIPSKGIELGDTKVNTRAKECWSIPPPSMCQRNSF